MKDYIFGFRFYTELITREMRISSILRSSYQYKPFDLGNIVRSQIDDIGSANYRVFLQDISKRGKLISPWHDIPLDLGAQGQSSKSLVVPFVCEIPRGRVEKMEVLLKEKFNPIAQDTNKDGQLRNLSVIPKFNYGMIPRTFETPDKNCVISGHPGDGDPIDVVDISIQGDRLEVGSVVPVKVLGSFCFIDGGEADWKIIVTRNDNETITKTIQDELFGFFETYKPNQNNYIFGDTKLFDINDTIDVLQCASDNYKELRQAYRTMKGRGEADEREPINIWVPGIEAI